jgi:hypothetical protein
MSNRKLAKAIQNLSREVQKLYRQINRATVNWLLRSAFVANRRGQSAVAGFILPTAVLLILILTLTVGAMTLRAFDRNVQVITNAQEKVLYNAATPAIDRARSKLEFLFDAGKDVRYPGGTPFESYLVGMLTNDGTNGVGNLPGNDSNGNTILDPYTLPDEKRVDIGSPNDPALDNKPDNAWRFRTDTNGDGKTDASVLYSIIFSTPPDLGPGTPKPSERLLTMTDQQKANMGVVRNGPLSSQTSLAGCSSGTATAGGFTQEAWFQDEGNTSKIRKNFQVNAIVIPDDPKVASVTMEFQQDRQILKGNKWGAWFRYDLEIFPGPPFNWNGAMHTEGNMTFSPNEGFTAYLVSAPGSCLYQRESSELSATNVKDTAGIGDFIGHVAVGKIGRSPFRGGGSTRIHIHPASNAGPPANPGSALTPTNDASLEPTAGAISNFASDPVTIVLEERTQSVKATDRTNRTGSGWAAAKFTSTTLDERFLSKPEKIPFVDDLYRADDRWGPKPKYYDDPTGAGKVPAGVAIGTDIPGVVPAGTLPTANRPLLSTPAPTGKTPQVIGLDGYWERRAYTEGMRLLVGERLELGNIGGWVTPRDVPAAGSPKGDGFITPPAANAGTPAPIVDESTPGANPNTWTELEGDPLYPPTVAPFPFREGTTLPHLTQQRRTLRDNIPAVQSATVYHAAVGQKDYPVACMAMTVHPGTQNTLRQSINFFPTSFKNGTTTNDALILSDFFNGRGTDGWEYAPPGGDVAQFVAQLGVGQPLRIALDNLANFAGDPDGAFPPKQEAGLIHPYPALTMWGNYSNLKRAMRKLAAAGGYNSLSIADKSYIQTAACSLGMLATNVDQLQKFNPTNFNNDVTWNNAQSEVMSDLADKLSVLMDGRVENGEVLPKARLSTYDYSNTGTFEQRKYDASDYYEVPPEAFLAGIRQQVISTGGDYMNSPLIRMAELIMTSQQVRRDRTFGFRPSPAFGEYAVSINSAIRVFPSACDPDQFALAARTVIPLQYDGVSEGRDNTSIDATTGRLKPFTPTYGAPIALPGAVGGDLGRISGRRLALSRLCGGLRIPAGYTAGAAVLNDNPAGRPVVLPKFPSLYYIFPEVEHGLTGAFVNSPAPGADPGFTDEVANRDGEWDHRQPGAIAPARAVSTTASAANNAAAAAAGVNPYDREPYVIDQFIRDSIGAYTFQPVSTALPAPTSRQAAYPTPTAATNSLNPISANLGTLQTTTPVPQFFSRLPYANSSPFPTADLSVSAIALAPRAINGFPAGATASVLPSNTPRDNNNDTSPNRIMIPRTAAVATAPVKLTLANANDLPTQPWAVPFLDWAMFDGRQLQVARVTDFDLGMLRSNKPEVQSVGTEYAVEPWLPMSGIVYAFREDAVREDGVARPPGGTIPATGVTNDQLVLGNAMNATNPTASFDPPVQSNKGNISIKAIDNLPDPARRVHGFRMRNGTQLKRNAAGIDESKNIRGISFISDQPVYMFGDFNLHQDGTNNDTRGTLLEEFTQKLPEAIPAAGQPPYSFDQFYTDRTTRDPNFAVSTTDRWRPSEILADSISILSNGYCDGSIADAFVNPSTNPRNIPDFSGQSSGDIRKAVYNQLGLYSQGCAANGGNGNTSYQNQNRVQNAPPTDGWEWKREGAAAVVPSAIAGTQSWSDFTTPIQIGRTGEPLLIARPINRNPTLPVNYGIGGFNAPYATPNENRGTRLVASAADTRVNAIVVSGISPSRPGQSYGGLHNFPRFIEQWNGRRFWFSGSFLQLNFSNYATGPFEQEGWEPGAAFHNTALLTSDEPIPHYQPPVRLWGYDVALQFAPAGPVAARFVAPSATKSEFYTEPPVSDPYINKLCRAAQAIQNQNLTATNRRIDCVTQTP